MPLKLSVVDQSPVSAGSTPADALHNTIDLARLTERLGYTRYWIAEHHAMQALASPAPEVLIARVAAETSSIRVGSGGVLLPHYSPLKVAETFRMLHALYPGRIDLGVGRAPGGSPLETYALRRDRSERTLADDFPAQLTELLNFLYGGFPANHPFNRITVSPEMPGAPEVWLLGSSLWSAAAAAHFGLPYAFAHFIDPQPTRMAVEQYRFQFKPSRYLSAPRAIVALGVLCADTDQEAQRLLMSARLFRRRIRQGLLGPIPTIGEAIQELGPPIPRPNSDDSEWPRYFAGAPHQVRDQLSKMATALQLEELMVVTIVHDHQARRRSYELLAQVFELQAVCS
ncbi:MAG TPA: LLM class flavin-dependent oxidoreductase [Candidatus Angelobacter sp.]|jgi:luciferase family oxidoreductase group 1|nr:LLM class flavin-dependent oxidoreductase [Candidatus Angelobacter sp.]